MTTGRRTVRKKEERQPTRRRPAFGRKTHKELSHTGMNRPLPGVPKENVVHPVRLVCHGSALLVRVLLDVAGHAFQGCPTAVPVFDDSFDVWSLPGPQTTRLITAIACSVRCHTGNHSNRRLLSGRMINIIRVILSIITWRQARPASWSSQYRGRRKFEYMDRTVMVRPGVWGSTFHVNCFLPGGKNPRSAVVLNSNQFSAGTMQGGCR